MKRIPSFIIIGAMKSATSTLHVQLAAQAGIAMARPKEPNFFSDDENYHRGFDWYAEHFAHAPADALIGEASTHYAKLPTWPRTVERLYAAAPDARLIYVMRHPVDRMVSQYIHEWTEGLYACSIDEAIDRRLELIAYSQYAMQLRPYFEVFGRDHVLPVFFDRLRAAPQEELERICRFIGYPGTPQWQPESEKQNVSRDRLRKSRLRSTLLAVPGLRTLVRGVLPAKVRQRVNDVWRMRQRPELSDDARRRLTEVFDADLAQLGAWLQTPLSCATFVDVTAARALEWSEPATLAGASRS